MTDATMDSSAPARASTARKAVVYRMVTPNHLCPYGKKSLWLLGKHGFEVDDRPLTSREETDAFKEKHGVKTTPQVWIDGERIGGYEALRKHLGVAREGKTYVPVIALFSVTFLMALGLTWNTLGTIEFERLFLWFIGLSMGALAIQKLRDLDSFTTMFLNYDLLARRYVGYGYFYAFAEAYTGIGMVSGLPWWMVAPVGLFIGTVGAVSVFKAVYIDNRELKCACMGGDSNVPLGFISLTENLMMVAAALWMILS